MREIGEAYRIMSKGWCRQVILYGPPGTGKTYHGEILAAWLLEGGQEAPDAQETKARLSRARQDGRYELLQFHPSYSYEDFVRGVSVRPAPGGGLSYETEKKVFERFCEREAEGPKVLVIDEINRAPLAAVLGELIYGLEYRGWAFDTPYALPDGSRSFTVPEDLWIIGTMNTADRSVGTIDYAVRRRFAFVPLKALPPEEAEPLIRGSWADPALGEEACRKYAALYRHFAGFCERDADPEEICIGHTFFLGRPGCGNERQFLDLRVRQQVLPMLHEYQRDGLLRRSLTDEDWFREA